MNKLITLLLSSFVIIFLAGCSSGKTINTTQEIDPNVLKQQIKEEVLVEIRQDLQEQVADKVEDLEDAVEEIEDEVEQVEDNVEELETDQTDLENLFDIAKLEITTQSEDYEWNFSTQWDELIRTKYPTDVIDIDTPYTVLIKQVSNEYKITNENFDITLTLQQCSFGDDGEIYAYFVKIVDSSDKELNGCANVKL